MSENRYDVDEILREVREKRAKESGARPAGGIAVHTDADALLADLEKVRPKASEPVPQPVPATPPASVSAPEAPRDAISETPAPAVPAAAPAPASPLPHEEAALPEPEELTVEAAPHQESAGARRACPSEGAWNERAACEECLPIRNELESRSHRITASFIINLVALAGTLYLALAAMFHLMLPDLLAGSAAYRVWGMVGLVAVSALACGGTLGNGLISLFTARKSNDAYVTLTVFACLLQGSFMAARPELMADYTDNLYLPLAAGILLFNTIGKMVDNARQRDNCEAITHQPPVECSLLLPGDEIVDWAAKLPENAGNVLCFNPASASSEIGDALEQPGHVESLAGAVAPIAAGASLVMAVIAYFLGGNLFNSACIFTAALCITSPFAASLGSHLPLRRTNQGLHRWKASLLSGDAVQRLSDADAVLLRCADLFPAGSVTLHGIKTFDKKPVDEAIVNAASILCCVDSTLSGVFRNMIGTRDILKPVDNIVSEDGMGLSAWVDGGRVLIGNRELLQHHGVAVPPIEFEQQLEEGRELLYLSNFGSLSAGFVISYRADKQVTRQLAALEDSGVAILLHTTDPNITPARVSQVYGISEGCIHLLPSELHSHAEKSLHAKAETPAGMTSVGFAGNLHCLLAAQRSLITAKTIGVLLLLEVLIGFALITFLAYTGAMTSLTWMAIGAYQLIWLLLVLLNGLFRK